MPLSPKWLRLPTMIRRIGQERYYLAKALRKHDYCLFPYIAGIGKTERRAIKDLYDNIKIENGKAKVEKSLPDLTAGEFNRKG